MAERVVLHVGTMKSGTTHIQRTLFENQDALGGRGVFVPGPRLASQLHALRERLGLDPNLHATPGSWARLAAEIAAADGTGVVSAERLGPMHPAKVKECVQAFRELAGEIEVVVTARDLAGALGSLWQESLQNGRTWTWTEYAAGAGVDAPGTRSPGPPATPGGRHFWHQMGLTRIVATWAREVGADRVTVVAVPPRGSADDLVGRFARAAGFDDDGVVRSGEANSGCGVASLEVLRRLGEELGNRGRPAHIGMRARKSVLAKTVLGRRRSLEGRVGLAVPAWAGAEAARSRQGLEELGTAFIGDWTDLTPRPVVGVSPEDVAEGDVFVAARAGLDGLDAWLRSLAGDAPVPAGGPVADADEAVARLADLVELSVSLERS